MGLNDMQCVRLISELVSLTSMHSCEDIDEEEEF
jgi:hypothetical protein